MGAALWLNLRRGDSIECSRQDCPLIYALVDDLDAIAARLRDEGLLYFFDYTAVELDADEQLLAAGEGGAAAEDTWTADRSDWFDAEEGLALLDGLIKHIRQHPDLFSAERGNKGAQREGVLAELEACREILREAEKHDWQFHFAVVP